jgi:hypothetical protein
MCQAGKPLVILNSCEARGLGLLVFIQTLGYTLGFETQILNPASRVRKLLDMTRLNSVLNITREMRRLRTQNPISTSGHSRLTAKLNACGIRIRLCCRNGPHLFGYEAITPFYKLVTYLSLSFRKTVLQSLDTSKAASKK